MSLPYFKLDFRFSDTSIHWIERKFHFLFTKPRHHYLYRTKNFLTDHNVKVSFKNSLPLREIKAYLLQYGIPENYYDNEENGPDIFVSVTTESKPPHPHIDETQILDPSVPNGVRPVLTRFNTFITYSPYEDMYWWEDVVPGHPLVVSYENGVIYQKLGIKGNGALHKLYNLGQPSHISHHMYKDTQSAFVRTDCAHSVSSKFPGTRFGITVSINKTIDELITYYNHNHGKNIENFT